VETGQAPEIRVGQISTSDPLIFLGVNAVVIIALGRAIKWGIGIWKDIEDIRKVRAETEKLKAHSKDELKAFFDDKITVKIQQAVEEKAAALVEESKLDQGRKNEIKKPLSDALEVLLAYVERGMTIELRMLPPPTEAPNEDGTEPEKTPEEKNAAAVQALKAELKFLEPPVSPIMALPNGSG